MMNRPTIGNSQFQTTRWTLIASARDQLSPDSREALSELCRTYWYPLYAYVRRHGHDAETAADLIQGFFSEFVDGRLLRSVDQEKGKFRAYLLGGLKHYLSNERQRARAQKRGGNVVSFSIDDAEARYHLEPAHQMTPEHIFERRWALTVLESALSCVRERYERAGKSRQFAILKDLLAGPLPDRSYAQFAEELQTTEAAVKTAVHRLRGEYRKSLERTIAETVLTPDEIEEEIQHLYAALRNGG